MQYMENIRGILGGNQIPNYRGTLFSLNPHIIPIICPIGEQLVHDIDRHIRKGSF